MSRAPASLLALPLVLAYPLLAHLAAQRGSATLALLSILVLGLVMLLPALAARRWWGWLTLAGLAGALWWLQQRGLGLLPLFAPPVLINAFLAWLFGHTLVGGRRPFIEQIVWQLHERPASLPPDVVAYARRLTRLWTGLFVVMASVNLVLALLARPDGLLLSAGVQPPWTVSRELWSLVANVLGYLLVAVLFVAEYAWRQRIFPEQQYRHFGDFLWRVVRLPPRFWRGILE